MLKNWIVDQSTARDFTVIDSLNTIRLVQQQTYLSTKALDKINFMELKFQNRRYSTTEEGMPYSGSRKHSAK